MDNQKEREAIAELSRAIAFKADVHLLHLRAAFHEHIGDVMGALRDCRAALSVDPNHQEMLELHSRVNSHEPWWPWACQRRIKLIIVQIFMFISCKLVSIFIHWGLIIFLASKFCNITMYVHCSVIQSQWTVKWTKAPFFGSLFFLLFFEMILCTYLCQGSWHICNLNHKSNLSHQLRRDF